MLAIWLLCILCLFVNADIAIKAKRLSFLTMFAMTFSLTGVVMSIYCFMEPWR